MKSQPFLLDLEDVENFRALICKELNAPDTILSSAGYKQTCKAPFYREKKNNNHLCNYFLFMELIFK